MLRQLALCILIATACTSCGTETPVPDHEAYQPPDWRRYRASNVPLPTGPANPSNRYQAASAGRFSFRDLKTESDESLARRLLGQAGARIAYIDRHRHRWPLYQGDEDGAESIDLYTHPYAMGSQFGLCGVEKYAIEFADDGSIESVRVSQRYGIEGPIFERGEVDSNRYSALCASAAPAHAPSYFPAPDALLADDGAELLVVLFDLAASPGPLPFPLQCRTWDRRTCSQNVRAYLGRLRLGDIDEFSQVNCPLGGAPEGAVCFTIKTDESRVGPFPKYITVRGSTHMNALRLDSVEIVEGHTMS